jgi:hypothetical protein
MVWFSRLLLAVAVALVLGTTLTSSVDATKKGKNTIASVKDRISAQRDYCELLGGGELDVRRGKGATRFTYCEGGQFDGTSCKHTEGASQCKCETTGKKGFCEQAIATPPDAGEPGPGGRATNAGGGATVPPPSEADPGNGEPEQPILQ